MICYNIKVVNRRHNAGMAQSVEHVIGNDEVISSILITSSRKSTSAKQMCFFSYIGIEEITNVFGGFI